MKLFLTSYAAHSLDKVVPLLGASPEMLKVAFIPTASDIYHYRPWIDSDRQKLVSLGFKVFDVGLQSDLDQAGFPVGDRVKKESELRSELLEADILFVGGGNTFYLLEQAQKSGFLKIAKEMVNSGTIYIGSSAGSVLAGPDIEAVEFFDNKSEAGYLNSTRGLGFVDFVVLPHFVPGVKDPIFDQTIEIYKNRNKLVTLTNSQVIEVEDSVIKTL